VSPTSASTPERVYAALVPSQLAHALATGSLPPEAPVHAVTPALREHYTDGDTEELELAAMLDAADSSLRLLAGDGGEGGQVRRLVLAADVPAASVRPRPSASGDPAEALSRVELAEPLAVRAVVSAHVDEVDAQADVAAAARALAAADAGDDDASFTVDGAQGHDLLWYDATELAELADELTGP